MTKLICDPLFALTFLFFLSSCETLEIPELTTGRAIKHSSLSLASQGLRRTGKTYTGKASWYSVRTNGGTATASGERFRNDGMTAAHKTLPMGTMVEVTNLLDNETIILRINDRGPYIRGRIIDVSIGAANKMGWVGRGVIPVKVTVLERTGSSGSFRNKSRTKKPQQPSNILEVFGLN